MEKKQEITNTNESAYVQNVQAMNTILWMMKEKPELTEGHIDPKSDDHFALERVEFPEAGGILTYMQGQKYPYKGFPLGEFVEKNDTMKKLSKGILSGLFHQIFKVKKNGRIGIKNIWKLFAGIIAFKSIVRAEIYTFHRLVERVRIKPDKYCDAMRELYRAGSIPIHKENDECKKLRESMRDILCMHLEFDNAYRYRFQDIAEVHNPIFFEKNPIKEMLRCFTIMQSREVKQEVSDSWTLTKMLVNYLRFDKELRRIIINIFKNLDIEKIRLSVEDISYCEPRNDYNFGFKKLCQ